jgi:hypothetical protein
LPDFQVVEELIAQRGTVWLAWSRWVRILIIYKINYLSSCFSVFHFFIGSFMSRFARFPGCREADHSTRYCEVSMIKVSSNIDYL